MVIETGGIINNCRFKKIIIDDSIIYNTYNCRKKKELIYILTNEQTIDEFNSKNNKDVCPI